MGERIGGGGLYIVREKRKKRGEVHAIMKRKLMKYCTSSTERERVRRLGGYMIERGGGRESEERGKGEWSEIVWREKERGRSRNIKGLK